MKLYRSLSLLGLFVSSATAICRGCLSSDTRGPTAKTLNGTYYGERLEHSYTESFLGMPYSQPPVGDLRLRLPRSLNTSWSGAKNATEYGYACVGFGEDTQVAIKDYVNEDCLTLNVVRPASHDGNSKLPVLVWIHGQGSSRDQRYNLTFIVEQSAKIGKPIVAVSLNYRLAGYGFFWSKEIVDAGLANLGLKDQRLALHWIQENISGFGGDPRKVTIWGESAGGMSVGHHLLAYNGRNDHLFRAAIAESGPPLIMNPSTTGQDVCEGTFREFVSRAGCEAQHDQIACLRSLSYDEFRDAHMNDTVGYWANVDGQFFAHPVLEQLKAGKIVKVPYLTGDNSDEGTAFSPFGVNTDEDFTSALSSMGFDNETVAQMAILYPNNPKQLIPETHPKQFNSTIGLQWKRIATVLTDTTMVAPRKLTIDAIAKVAPIFTYRFNTIPNGVEDVWAVTHFMEMPFVLNNLDGVGYPDISQPYLGPNPLGGNHPLYIALADLMSRMWVSFAHELDPNCHPHSGPQWPRYTSRNKTQIVFDALKGVHLEAVNAIRPNATRFLIEHMWKQVGKKSV